MGLDSYDDYLYLLNLPLDAPEDDIKRALTTVQREYSRKANVSGKLEHRQKAEQMLKTLEVARKVLLGSEGKFRRSKLSTKAKSIEEEDYDNSLRFLKLRANAADKDIQNAIKDKERVYTEQATSQNIRLRHEAETILEEIKKAYTLLLGSKGHDIRKKRSENKSTVEQENIEVDSDSIAKAIELIALKRGRKTQARKGTVLYKRASFFLKGMECYVEEIIHKKYEAVKDYKFCVAKKNALLLFEWECNIGRSSGNSTVKTFVKGQWRNDIIEGKVEIEMQ
jgi:hypothetical protein